jgi:hypothetical protein
MLLTRKQIEIVKQIVRGAIEAYKVYGWVRKHAFTDEHGKYVSVIAEDRPKVKACGLVGALMIGMESADIGNERYSLDNAIYCVTRSLPKEYQGQPLGIYNWNDHECKSRAQAVRLLQTVLHRLESV